jgi:hypothetical protein
LLKNPRVVTCVTEMMREAALLQIRQTDAEAATEYPSGLNLSFPAFMSPSAMREPAPAAAVSLESAASQPTLTPARYSPPTTFEAIDPEDIEAAAADIDADTLPSYQAPTPQDPPDALVSSTGPPMDAVTSSPGDAYADGHMRRVRQALKGRKIGDDASPVPTQKFGKASSLDIVSPGVPGADTQKHLARARKAAAAASASNAGDLEATPASSTPVKREQATTITDAPSPDETDESESTLRT